MPGTHKKKKSVKAMGGGYMSAMGNSKTASKKDKEKDEKRKGQKMSAMGGGYMSKRKKPTRKK